MLAPTHMVFGQATFLAASIATQHAPAPLEILAAALCALLPDLDKRQSYIGRALPFISEPLDYHFGHRTLTHSLLFQCAVACLTCRLLPFGAWLALVCGLVSHTVADMMTPQGVAWFWPSSRRCVLPGNPRYRFEPMSWAELWFAVVIMLACFPLGQLAQSGAGTTGLIRQAIGDISKAREDYDARKGTHAWRLQLKGRDNRRYVDVSGDYPVIGPWGEGGFLLETTAGPRSACRAAGCDWYAEHAVLVRGEPEATTTRIVKAESLSVATLTAALVPLRAVGQVYLLGSFRSRQMAELPPTVSVAGETVTLRYADPEILAGLAQPMLREVDLLVQIRHAPGSVVPDLHMKEAATNRLDPLIQRWIE